MTDENNKAQVHTVFSVIATSTEGVYLVDADVTDLNGQRYRCNYVSSPTDTFGMGPTIRQWLADNAGTITIAPYVPPTAEQQRSELPSLTARQLRLGLIDGGITPAQVQAAIDAMPAGADREKALVEWEYASAFSRSHPLIASVGAALGLIEEQIDEMWIAALSL